MTEIASSILLPSQTLSAEGRHASHAGSSPSDCFFAIDDGMSSRQRARRDSPNDVSPVDQSDMLGCQSNVVVPGESESPTLSATTSTCPASSAASSPSAE